MDKTVIGYKFKGIEFYLNDGKLVSDLGVSFIRSNDIQTLRTLIETNDKTLLKESDRRDKNEIEVSISNVRRLLWDMGSEYEIIKTIPGAYRFITEVKPIYRDQPQPTPAPNPTLIDPRADSATNFFKKWLISNKFNQWLFDPQNKVMWITLSLVLGTFVASFLVSFNNAYSLSVVSGIQAGILLLAILYPIYDPESIRYDEESFNKLDEEAKKATDCATFRDWKDTSETAEKVLEQYKVWWKWVLISWFALYISFIFARYPQYSLDLIDHLKNPALPDLNTTAIIAGFSILNTLLNNFSSLMIFICFSILNSPTKFNGKKTKIHNLFGIGFFVVLALTVLEYSFYKIPSAYPNIATLRYFDGLSGIVAGAIMALYFGRLQSKFLNPPPWLIISLFTYTAIQSLYVVLDIKISGIILMNSALVFKCLLFLYMTFLFQTERLFFYFVRVRKTYENVEDEYDNFKVIKGQALPEEQAAN